MTETGMHDQLRQVIGAVSGVEERPSAFKEDDAYRVNGKEIAHIEADDVLEIRLTRANIRDMRGRLRADPRVTLRTGTSDWIAVTAEEAGDLEFVTELIERAAAAHRAPEGAIPRSPPTGAALERRRRFH